MKVLGINGSPRKGWNTQTLVKKALEGAADAGAETELIDLYAQPLKGCLECYACKRKGIKTDGLCAIHDNMRPLLEKAREADVIIVGSPNYFGYPTAMTFAFLERFLFPITSYQVEDGKQVHVLGKRVVPAGVIYTMNADEKYYHLGGYEISMGRVRDTLEYLLGYAEQYNSYMTLQFKDYSVMNANMFNGEARHLRHETQFPVDEQKCYEMGKRLVLKAHEMNVE
ncbi:MAG: flavodoxin family protein [Muribaculaceae bacterium]|nr:flavodoxin family protein [Muribaculaceae bacterium]